MLSENTFFVAISYSNSRLFCVSGVMIYYPVFGAFPSFYGGSMDDYLRDTVSIRKDVEGLSNTYRRNLYHNIRHAEPVFFWSLRRCTGCTKPYERITSDA